MNMEGIRKGERPFVDDLRFPRGFNRSGDFSINDSVILKDYGITMKQLYDGAIFPENDAERHFCDVVNGKLEPETSFERVWLRYLQKINNRTFHTLNSRAKEKTINDMESDDFSIDV